MQTQVEVIYKLKHRFLVGGNATSGEEMERAKDRILRSTSKTLKELRQSHPGLIFIGYEWDFELRK